VLKVSDAMFVISSDEEWKLTIVVIIRYLKIQILYRVSKVSANNLLNRFVQFLSYVHRLSESYSSDLSRGTKSWCACNDNSWTNNSDKIDRETWHALFFSGDAGSIFETHANESKQEEGGDRFILFVHSHIRTRACTCISVQDNKDNLAAVSTLCPYRVKTYRFVELDKTLIIICLRY